MSFRLINNIPQVTAKLQREAKKHVHDMSVRIERTAIDSIEEGDKSGRIYLKGKAPKMGKRGKKLKDRRKEHRASAPGEPPATDSGQLVGSIEYSMTGDTSAAVGTNVEHGMHAEFGTSQMEPRPWLGPAFEEAAPEFEKGVKELLK